MKITLEQVRTTASKIVQGNEGFVYTAQPENSEWTAGCAYMKNGEPSCLVGKILSALGVSDDTLRTMDEAEDTTIAADALGILEGDGFDVDGPALDYLANLQAVQDRRGGTNSWGDALRIAEVDVS